MNELDTLRQVQSAIMRGDRRERDRLLAQVQAAHGIEKPVPPRPAFRLRTSAKPPLPPAEYPRGGRHPSPFRTVPR